MGWTNAAWLAGAAAIVIPILLHLRDRHPPDVVRVGSIADLVPAAAVQRRRRLDDIPLLLIRCLIVGLAAALMAGPQVDTASRAPGARIALVTAGDTLADSLIASGLRVTRLPRSPHPWVLAAWADTAIGAHDTLLLPAAAASMHTGVRPAVAHAVIPMGATPAGMVPTHRAPRTEPVTDVPARRRDRTVFIWWLLVGAIATERVVASRARSR